MDFNDLENWLQGIEPENRGVRWTMEVVAKLVVSSQTNNEVVKQAEALLNKDDKKCLNH
jgi:hypothetical protein